MPDAELVARLSEIHTLPNRVEFLDLVCWSLERTDGELHRSAATVLERLLEDSLKPGPEAVAVDHATRRLLKRLTESAGRRVATKAAQSPRKVRRMAAWSFFRSHGLDSHSREYLFSDFSSERNEEYLKVVAADHELVLRIGPALVVPTLPNRYWRSLAIQACLAEPQLSIQLRDAYPAEWLWAVARISDRSKLADIRELLARSSDPDIVNRVLLCAMELGDDTLLDEAFEAGVAALDVFAEGEAQ